MNQKLAASILAAGMLSGMIEPNDAYTLQSIHKQDEYKAAPKHKDKRKVEYYTDEKGQIRRRKR